MPKDHTDRQAELPFSVTQPDDEFNRQPSDEWREPGIGDLPAPQEVIYEPPPVKRQFVSPETLRDAYRHQKMCPPDTYYDDDEDED